ncbi:MAG: elongation factor Ts [Chlamydiales bacterium]|nr:elongation factor Ts [Chlamydiales bacterium]
MAQVTAEMVKQLRERTGVGMGKCKEALDSAHGDIEQAIDILRKAGMASAVKKEARETKEGMISFAQSPTCVAVVEINAETDFVVQNERFQHFVAEVCNAAAKNKPHSLDDLIHIKLSNGRTVEEMRADNIQSLGENIRIKRLYLHMIQPNTSVGIYSHMGGKILCLVEISGASDQQGLAKEVALHAVAEAPEYMGPADVPASVKAREEEIAKAQVQGKPQNIIAKIVDGKMQAFYAATCLPLQKFVKDPSITVQQYVEQEGKKTNKHLVVKSFIRWQVGE